MARRGPGPRGGAPFTRGPFRRFPDTVSVASPKARLSQQYVEVIHSGSNTSARLSQQYVEVIHSGSAAKARLSQQYAEVIHSLDRAVNPPLFSDTESFFAPTITSTKTLTAGFVASDDGGPSPTVLDIYLLIPGIVSDSDTLFAPTLPHTLSPGVVGAGDTFFSSSISGGQSAHPSLFGDSDTFRSPSISTQDFFIPSRIVDPETFFAPVVHPGPIFVTPPRVQDVEIFYTTTVRSIRIVAPLIYVNPDIFFTPSANRVLSPTQIMDAEAFFSPTFKYNVTLVAPFLVDTDRIFTPAAQLQKKQGGGGSGGGGGTLSKNLKYATSITMQSSGLIYQLEADASTSSALNTRMGLYADNGGFPGALLAVTPSKSSIVSGPNIYALNNPYSVLAGTTVWVALQSDNNFNWFLTNSPGGARWNNDLFTDGLSDPFGSSNVDNKKAPVFVIFLSSATINLTVSFVSSDDAFPRPAILSKDSVLSVVDGSDDFFFLPSISATDAASVPRDVDQDIFRTAGISSSYGLHPGLFGSDDTVYAPGTKSIHGLGPSIVADQESFYVDVSSTSKTFHPLFFSAAETIYSPTIGAAGVVFSAAMGADDSFFVPHVVPQGAKVSPPFFSAAETIFTSRAAPGQNNVVSASIPSGDAFFSPTVSPQAVSISPPLFTSGELFFTPVQKSSYGTAASFVVDQDVVYDPDPSLSNTLQPRLVTDVDRLSDIIVERHFGDHSFGPDIIDDAEVFFVATIARVAMRRHVPLPGEVSDDVSPSGELEAPLGLSGTIDNQSSVDGSLNEIDLEGEVDQPDTFEPNWEN